MKKVGRTGRSGSTSRKTCGSKHRLFGSASRLRDLLDQYLNAVVGEEPLARLTALEEKLSKRLLFVVIRVGNVDDAFLLFETLNDRGLQLSAADLVKSHLLSRIEAEKGKDAVPAASQEWGEVVDLLRPAPILVGSFGTTF